MPHPRTLLVVALLVVCAAVTAAVPAAAQSSGDSCDTVVRHDAFRHNTETVNTTVNGTGTSAVQNTKVSVEPTSAFVRIQASNPNGYCVRFVVELAPEIVTPASLGSVDSNNESYTATWRAVHDFNASKTYTEVAFTLPAGTKAGFAPAKARVAALKWTGDATDTSAGLLGDVDLPFGDDEQPALEQRHYRFTPTNDTDIITVPLQNGAGNRTIDEYRAVYTTPTTDGWRPVGTDSSAPVFERQLDGGDAVQFQFNRNATVKFTANPTRLEKAEHQWTAYWAGVDFLDDFFGGSENDA